LSQSDDAREEADELEEGERADSPDHDEEECR
jgi:hypothetical protein